TLCSLAGSMRKRGMSAGAILAALTVENEGRCEPPLPAHQVEKIARSVGGYGPEPFAGVTLKFTPVASLNGEAHAPVPQAVPAFGPIIPASRVKRVTEEAKWVWHGYLARSSITLFSALWKAGKTTLLAHLLRALAGPGRFCGLAVQ